MVHLCVCVFEECVGWAKTDRQWNLESVAAYFYQLGSTVVLSQHAVCVLVCVMCVRVERRRGREYKIQCGTRFHCSCWVFCIWSFREELCFPTLKPIAHVLGHVCDNVTIVGLNACACVPIRVRARAKQIETPHSRLNHSANNDANDTHSSAPRASSRSLPGGRGHPGGEKGVRWRREEKVRKVLCG